MNCREDESKLSAWMDSELSEAEAREVQAHVEGCLRCRKVVDELASVKSLVISEVEPDPHFVVRFRALRDERSGPSVWAWRKLALRLLPLAAAVLAAALLSVTSSAPPGDFDALELAALDGPPLATLEAGEPVLSIALAPFPARDR